MLRRRVPWWVVGSLPTGDRPSREDSRAAVCTQARTLKTLDVREYRPLGTPIEFRFYQRYANHPNRQSGIQFLTHYNTHQRFRVNKDFIDYLRWGKEQGQARLPHRHQRVAFDFDDVLQPTRTERTRTEWFAGQDPTVNSHPDLSTSFDPNKKLFSHPEHWNKMFSKRRPGEGDIRLDVLDSPSMLGPLMTQTDTQEVSYFQTETQGPSHGKVPGLNSPFLGEFDRKMMQAMSRPMNADHTITGVDGRFSKTLFINEPGRHQALSANLAKELNRQIDMATNAVYTKLTVLEAAQSGQTDFFCGGMDLESLGFDLRMAAELRQRAQHLADAHKGGSLPKKTEQEVQQLLRDATRHYDRAEDMLREHAALIWRAYTAARPLMTLVNGRCRGTGCGLALAAKYCAMKDSSEFIFDGPGVGLTPYGGLTRFLARPETSLKYPGLAEFVMLTGTSLFAGDALRLGWTDLFTTLPDMSYHIKQWFDDSEHMHNDAVAWQLGHLLETCFKMHSAHTSAMERCAITPIRARWVEDAFADQPSVEAIVKTLTLMERMPLTDPDNSQDTCHATPFTLSSVSDGVEKLSASRLRYTLSPWDITPPEEEVAVRQAADIFTSYVLERHGTEDIVVHRDRGKLRRWKEQREREYVAYTELKTAPHPRHVYARLEGCENQLVEFDFTFDPSKAKEKEEARAGALHSAREEPMPTAMLRQLKAAIRQALDMPQDRDIELGWYLPTLDTCPVQNDTQLMEVLHTDPGLEDPRANLKYPPLYFTVKRQSLYLSEWAYAVKHQLLLQSPYALKATFELLSEVRGDGSAEAVKSLSDTLRIEFRYAVRAMRRPDFVTVGQYTNKSAEEWEALKEERQRHLHKSHRPLRPLPAYDDVFERGVHLDGHTFQLRPRWSPRTLEEVSADEVAGQRAPLRFDADGTSELDPAVHCAKADRFAGMLDDVGGVEVVSQLGEADSEGRPKVAPLESNAHVPTNVNFYEMARHPWDDTPSSWRRNGFTEDSKEYFEQQYREAERALYDEDGRGAYNYWPSKGAVEGTSGSEEASAALLEERLFGELKRAERGVEPWARTLRQNVTDGKLNYPMEIATQQEKIYDDEYYRWFIKPGQNPNPSGLLIGKKSAAVEGSEDRELEAFLRTLSSPNGGVSEDSTESDPTEDVADDVEAAVAEVDDVEAPVGDPFPEE